MTTLRTFLTALLLLPLPVAAQQIHNPMETIRTTGAEYIHGRGFAMDNYCRLPDDAQAKVRPEVWQLSRNSAGLSLRFRTDARELTVRYGVAGPHAMPHMPATGVSGVDLYNNAGAPYPGGFHFGQDTIIYRYTELKPTLEQEYILNLPLYNTVEWLEIVTPGGASFEFIPVDPGAPLPIVVYGTSIAHGACASRPGMAWTNILTRTDLEHPVVNLGFSGNGRLEPEVLDYIVSIPASVYILDCMPNMYVEQDSIRTLVLNAVRQIRAVHPDTPILLTEHLGYNTSYVRASLEAEIDRANSALSEAYSILRREEGVAKLYYLSQSILSISPEGLVDYVHPSDLGMTDYAVAYHRALEKILNKCQKE